ncbi:unnamed protein product [Phaeothamnion confervicola]
MPFRPFLISQLIAVRSASSNSNSGVLMASDPDALVRATKAGLRKEVKTRLKVLEADDIARASASIAQRLSDVPGIADAEAVSVYLAMAKEAQTNLILADLFARGKKVYIPRIMGPDPADMRMFPLASLAEIESFPSTKWGIPEPSAELVLSREDGVVAGDIDVVVAPGCAFDAACNRLGHGKGYYDCFLRRAEEVRRVLGRPRAAVVGIGLDEQLLEAVPTSAHDVSLDAVVTPTRTFWRGGGTAVA